MEVLATIHNLYKESDLERNQSRLLFIVTTGVILLVYAGLLVGLIHNSYHYMIK